MLASQRGTIYQKHGNFEKEWSRSISRIKYGEYTFFKLIADYGRILTTSFGTGKIRTSFLLQERTDAIPKPYKILDYDSEFVTITTVDNEPELILYVSNRWGKIRQVYPPKNFLSPISLKVREIIVLVNLF